MRCTRVEFKGYRRLADTGTGIEGDITAFVGCNEAGKTSLLQGLEWLSTGGTFPPTDHNRSRPPVSDSAEVVQVFFDLAPADLALIETVPCDVAPTSLSLSRKIDGGRLYSLVPFPRRPAEPFVEAGARLTSARTSLARQFESARDEGDQDAAGWAVTVAAALEDPDATWSESGLRALADLRRWCTEVPQGRKTAREARLGSLLAAVEEIVGREPPAQEIWSLLAPRIPDFRLFREEYAQVESVYDLAPEHRTMPRSVHSLLRVARIDPDELWACVHRGDGAGCAAILEDGNDRLRELFAEAWNQSGVTVRLNVTGGFLEVMVGELDDDGAVTNIGERSDGLKRFVALAAFLAAGEHTVPPILLIDQAETQLHYDAQADLVGVLMKSLDVTQVFYTTHSPGCLPNDLGTGIRVLRRDPDHLDASLIQDDFWAGEGPGFSSLMFTMGVGAAAFSVCRQAVLTEGAADMVLLPTLIRLATEGPELEYQVAQGPASVPAAGLRNKDVAAKVCYLVHGDTAGAELGARLAALGADKARIFRLPKNCSIEDLIDPEDYRAVVNQLVEKAGLKPRFGVDDVRPDRPISTSFLEWAKAKRMPVPSEVEVAHALARHAGLRLTSAGRKALLGLDKKVTAAFAAAPELGSALSDAS